MIKEIVKWVWSKICLFLRAFFGLSQGGEKMEGEIEGGKVKVELEVRDKDGKLVQTTEQDAKSWLKNYYYWLAVLMRLGIAQSITDMTGATTTIIGGAAENCWDADSAARTGISVGSSNAAFDVNQYCLQSLENSGEVEALSVDIGAKKVVLTAVMPFGAEVTIRETGIRIQEALTSTGGHVTFYLERAVLGSPVTVPAGGSVTVKYTISHA